MKLGKLYDTVVARGMEFDPRGKAEIKRALEREKKAYEKLEGVEKEVYDTERLKNPFADTRILWGERDAEIRGILVGIDMEAPELLLADRLRSRGERIDLVLAHHPEGKALAGVPDVMALQVDVMAAAGVPVNVGEAVMTARIGEVTRGISASNHARAVDAARLLGINYMCAHTPCDNAVAHFLTKLFARKKPRTVGDVVDVLLEIPEYRRSAEETVGPQIFVGSKERRAGRIYVDMTGGTEPSEDAYAKLAEAGVGTVVAMHVSEKLRKSAEKGHVNVVVAGHIASDTLGLNLILDELVKLDGRLRFYEAAGFRRVERVKRAEGAK